MMMVEKTTKGKTLQNNPSITRTTANMLIYFQRKKFEIICSGLKLN